MPIVIIEAEKALHDRKALGLINRAVAEAIDAPRDTVWVRYECVPSRQYWEGDGTEPWAPVLVSIRIAKGRSRAKVRRMMDAGATACAKGLRMSKGSVWCRVDEIDADLVSQGGVPYSELRSKKRRR